MQRFVRLPMLVVRRLIRPAAGIPFVAVPLLMVLFAGPTLAAILPPAFGQGGQLAAPLSRPLADYPSDPAIMIDTPAEGASVTVLTTISGWAIDRNAISGTGVDAVHIYRDGLAGAGGTMLGAAAYGTSRPDVGAAFGAQFANSGWSFGWNATGLQLGSHSLYVYAHSSVSNSWTVLVRNVNLSRVYSNDPATIVDVPSPGANITVGTVMSGWSIDRDAATGTGVDMVHVYRGAPAGSGGIWVGAASYGGGRPDVGALYGAQFTNSGWSLSFPTDVTLGSHVLYVYAHSSVFDHWTVVQRTVNLVAAYANEPAMAVDAPAPGAPVNGTTLVSGWAIDRNAPSGTGVDAVHVYRDGPAGQGGVMLGAANYGGSRPDVGAAYGTQFTNSGWSFEWDTGGLSGVHTLYVYAHSSVHDNWTVATRAVTVAYYPAEPLVAISTPPAGAPVLGSVQIAGWAVDRNGAGSGIDAVHVYLDGLAGAGGTVLGAGVLGTRRSDVSAAFGMPKLEYAGWSFAWDTTGLSPGAHTLYVYAHSSANNTWVVTTRAVRK